MKRYILLPLIVISVSQYTNASCSVDEQHNAIKLYNKAFDTDLYTKKIELLEASLDSCYSPKILVDKYLWQGDYYYDNADYSKAKNYYNKMMREIDQINNSTEKQKYQLLYYKSMEELYTKIGKDDLASTMKMKYNLILQQTVKSRNNGSYVKSDDIYKQLSPSKDEKHSALRGIGIVEKKIRLSIEFDSGSSNLNRSGIKQSQALAKASQQLLKENRDSNLEIIGYTDTDGSARYNLILSIKRAKTIRNFLHNKYNISLDRVSYRGEGETKPICSNDNIIESNGEYSCSKENKKLSRRVEVRFEI